VSGTARIVILPLGELEDGGHPHDECVRCGASSRTEPCNLTVLPGTRAQAVICNDVTACERRRYWNHLERDNPDLRAWDDGRTWDEWFRALPLNPFDDDDEQGQ
jgi:hypothetical protein